MSAVILAFPRRSPIQTLCRAGDGSTPITPGWCAQYLPLIDAAMDLLAADDAEFGRRCQTMRDEDGRAMIDELAGQLHRLGTHIGDVASALTLTASRIRDDAMTAHERMNLTDPGQRGVTFYEDHSPVS